jgi:hypothetical protein
MMLLLADIALPAGASSPQGLVTGLLLALAAVWAGIRIARQKGRPKAHKKEIL